MRTTNDPDDEVLDQETWRHDAVLEPRARRALECRARRAAARVGLSLSKSRWRLPRPGRVDGYLLGDNISSRVVVGFGYRLTLQEVLWISSAIAGVRSRA